jgi:hypothetical protein
VDELLRVLAAVLVVSSLRTIVVYVSVFVAVAVKTLRGASRRNPLEQELDRVLDEILGRSPQRALSKFDSRQMEGSR